VNDLKDWFAEEAETRRWVEQRLSAEVPDDTWAFLVEQGYVAEASGNHGMSGDVLDEDTLTLEGLARMVKRLMGASSKSLQPQRRTRDEQKRLDRLTERINQQVAEIYERSNAVSLLLGIEARTDPMLMDFRRLVMHNKLAPWPELGAVIQRLAEAEGPAPARTLRVPIADDANLVRTETGGCYPEVPIVVDAEHPAFGVEPADRVSYVLNESGEVGSVPFRRGGVLHFLKLVGERLELIFGWDQSWAVTYAVTSVVPKVDLFSHRAIYKQPWRVMSRIELTIDPTLPHEIVAEQYKLIQTWFVKGKSRSLSRKHVRLAAFWAECQDVTDHEIMAGWNRDCEESGNPTWTYRNLSQFNRDRKIAQNRLLYPDLWTDYNELEAHRVQAR